MHKQRKVSSPHKPTFTLIVAIPQNDALLDDAVISKDTAHVRLFHKLGQLADEQFPVCLMGKRRQIRDFQLAQNTVPQYHFCSHCQLASFELGCDTKNGKER